MSEFLRCAKCGKILCASDFPMNLTSLDVAKLFGKAHRRVMQDIRKILLTEKGLHHFVQSSYKNLQGKRQPCFNIDREGFRMLSTRYKARGKGCVEIRNGKRVAKIYGGERFEMTCDRCGEVNVF
ncbi:MAG TPA: Rha family transcriptional regulator [Oscillospiraceae bacterium]|nr:Rha family transcriptional regulator [Oscillospiraceae bacterium]